MWQQYLDSFFPLSIETKGDVVLIEDRRPSDGLVVSATLAAVSLVFSALIFRPAIASGIYWPLILFFLPAPIFGVKGLLLPFREKYVFDKGQDSYIFMHHSLLKSQTTEGSLSQIRAVEIERSTVRTTKSGTREIFSVALLLQQGLLFGASDSVLLRKGTAVISSYERETKIASAIAEFLQLPVPEMVNI